MNRSLAQKGAVAASEIDLCRRVQIHNTTRGCIRVEWKGTNSGFRQGKGPRSPELGPVMRT